MPQINPPNLLRGNPPSRRRQFIALGVAILADLIHWAFAPVMVEGAVSPFDWAEDGIVTLILLLILGFRWELIAAFGLELVPFIDMFPTWTAFMLYIMAESRRRTPARGFPVEPSVAVPPVQGGVQPPPVHPPITVDRVK